MGKIGTVLVLLTSLIAASAACSAQHPAAMHRAAAVTRSPAASPAAPATAPSTPAAQPSHRAVPHHRVRAAPAPVPYGVECQSAALQLAEQRFPGIGAQETVIFALTNVSGTGCDLRGYPGIALFTVAGRPLPFHIRWGGDGVLTKAAPVLVPLAPGGTAYLGLNKEVCVRHYYRAAHIFQVIPPNDYQALSYSKPRSAILSYCRAGDPGHTVDVSPVEPTLRGVLGLPRPASGP